MNFSALYADLAAQFVQLDHGEDAVLAGRDILECYEEVAGSYLGVQWIEERDLGSGGIQNLVVLNCEHLVLRIDYVDRVEQRPFVNSFVLN